MKKLLLLALTLGTATALTACGGGAEKAVDSFLENHTDFLADSEVVNNYTVKTGSTTFKVAGNLLSVNGTNEFYSVNDDLTASYWYDQTLWFYETGDTYQGTTSYSKDVLNNESLTTSEFKGHTDAYNAFVGPFAQLVAAQSDVLGDKELSSKFFTSETVGEGDDAKEVIYFVVDKKETTVDNSPMTIEFTYALNAKEKETNEFLTATVKMGSTTWEYSNLSNEDYEFNTSTAHTLAAPGETMIENIVAIANTQDDMTATFSYEYTNSSDVASTAAFTTVINGDVVKLTTTNSNFDNQYVVANTDGSITLYTQEGNFWRELAVAAADIATEAPVYAQLLEKLTAGAGIDANKITTLTQSGSQTSGSTTTYMESTSSKLGAGDAYAAIRTTFWDSSNDITALKVYSYNSGTGTTYDGSAEQTLDVNTLYTITSFDSYAADADGTPAVTLADEVSALAIISEDFYVLVDMINNVDGEYGVENYNYTVTTADNPEKMLYADGYNNYVLSNGVKSLAINNLANDPVDGTNYTRYSVDTTDGNEGNWVLNGDSVQLSSLIGTYYSMSNMQSYFKGEVSAATFTSYDADTRTFSKTSSPSLSITLGDTLAECVITYQDYIFTNFGTVDLDAEIANAKAGGEATASTAAEVTAVLATYASDLTGNHSSNSKVGTVDTVMFGTMAIVWSSSDETVLAINESTGKGNLLEVAVATEFTMTATVTLADGTEVTYDYVMTNTNVAS